MVHPYLSAGSVPRVLAHRGFVSGAAAAQGIVENSRAAIAAAVDAGATFVESDCHLTADGVVVLAHDAHLDRVFGDPRAIAAVTRDELAGLMRGRGELITLEEALTEFPRTRFNIDVKADAVAKPAGQIIGPYADRVLLTSFDDADRLRALQAASLAGGARPATSPGRSALIRTLLALLSRSRHRIERSLAGFDALQIPERKGALRILTPRLIEAAHRHGVEVHVWTVNDPTRMMELVRMGVDGVITDRFDLAMSTLSPRE